MGFNYENAASRRRRGRPVSTEAPDRLRLRIEMKAPATVIPGQKSGWGKSQIEVTAVTVSDS